MHPPPWLDTIHETEKVRHRNEGDQLWGFLFFGYCFSVDTLSLN